MSDPFAVNPHVWVRTRKWFPPIVEDREELKKFAKNLYIKSKSSVAISEDEFDDIVSSFGGYLLLYEALLSANKDVHSELQKKKDNNTLSLMLVLDLKNDQTFSTASLSRFKLLQAVARGERITPESTLDAEYLMSKHGKIEAFLGVHPKGHLFLAVPMTKQSLKEIEPLVANQEQRLINQKQIEERRRLADQEQRLADQEQRLADQKQRLADQKQRLADQEQRVANQSQYFSCWK